MTRKLKVTQFGTERAVVYAKPLAQVFSQLAGLHRTALDIFQAYQMEPGIGGKLKITLDVLYRRHYEWEQDFAMVARDLSTARRATTVASVLQYIRDNKLLRDEDNHSLAGAAIALEVVLRQQGKLVSPHVKRLAELYQTERALLRKGWQLLNEVRAASGEQGGALPWKLALRPLARDMERMLAMFEDTDEWSLIDAFQNARDAVKAAASTRSPQQMRTALNTATSYVQDVIDALHVAVRENPNRTDFPLAQRRFRAFQTRFLLIKRQLLGA